MAYAALIGAASSVFAASQSGGGGGGSAAPAIPSGPINFGSITLGPKINGKGNSATAATASQGGAVNPGTSTASGDSPVMVWIVGAVAVLALLLTLLPRPRAQ